MIAQLLLVAFVAVPAASIVCPDMVCDQFCQNGYTTGQNGCHTCTCVSDSALDGQAPRCDPLTCFAPCTTGYTQDGNGCPTCNCGPDSAARSASAGVDSACPPAVYCFNPCDYGYANDDNGCPSCNCAPNTSSSAGD